MNPGPTEVLTAAEFTERVMTSIAVTSAPTPTRTFLAAVRVGALREAAAALWVAWHLSTVRGWHVGPRVRARSFALVLAVVFVLGTGSIAATAAVHAVVRNPTERAPAADPNGPGGVELGPTTDGRPVVSEPPTRRNVGNGPSAVPKTTQPGPVHSGATKARPQPAAGPPDTTDRPQATDVGGAGSGGGDGSDSSGGSDGGDNGSDTGAPPSDDGGSSGSGG